MLEGAMAENAALKVESLAFLALVIRHGRSGANEDSDGFFLM